MFSRPFDFWKGAQASRKARQIVLIRKDIDAEALGAERMRAKTMKRFFVAIVILVLLLVFNPSIDAHREAIRPYVDKCMNEAYQKGNWLSKLGLAIGGNDIKATIFDSVYRKSYGVFSVGYVDDKIATFGILGYVHVFE